MSEYEEDTMWCTEHNLLFVGSCPGGEHGRSRMIDKLVFQREWSDDFETSNTRLMNEAWPERIYVDAEFLRDDVVLMTGVSKRLKTIMFSVSNGWAIYKVVSTDKVNAVHIADYIEGILYA